MSCYVIGIALLVYVSITVKLAHIKHSFEPTLLSTFRSVTLTTTLVTQQFQDSWTCVKIAECRHINVNVQVINNCLSVKRIAER